MTQGEAGNLNRRNLTIRQVSEHEVESFLQVLGSAYGHDVDASYVKAWHGAFDHERNLALFQGDQLVGTATSGLVRVTVPGPRQVDAIVTGNLTIDRQVTLPGLSRGLFHTQCLRHQEEGVPFLVFSVNGEEMAAMHRGIGSSPMTNSLAVTAALANRRPHGSGLPDVEELDLFSSELDDLHERVAATVPGMIVRERAWMRTYRTLSSASTDLRVWGHRRPGGVLDGYAMWSRAEDTGTVVVEEFTAATNAANREITEALSRDTHILELRNRPLDDAVARSIAARGGHLAHRELHDALWIRILDVPRTLTARRYFRTDRICLEVVDRFLPQTAGRFLLQVSETEATCHATDEPADVRLTVGALGAILQGQVDPRVLLLAGWIEASDNKEVERLGHMMASPLAPWSGPER